MGLLSPLESSELGAIGRSHKLHFCKWHFSPIFTQPDQIELFLLISSNKFLLDGYKHSGTLFLGSSYHYLFKNIAHVRGICRFYPNCIFVFVFVYLCICIVYLHVRDLWTLLFRSWYHFLFKNIALVGSICKFDQTVFVYLCICICVFGPLTLLLDQFDKKNASPFSSTFLFGSSKWPKKC